MVLLAWMTSFHSCVAVREDDDVEWMCLHDYNGNLACLWQIHFKDRRFRPIVSVVLLYQSVAQKGPSQAIRLEPSEGISWLLFIRHGRPRLGKLSN